MESFYFISGNKYLASHFHPLFQTDELLSLDFYSITSRHLRRQLSQKWNAASVTCGQPVFEGEVNKKSNFFFSAGNQVYKQLSLNFHNRPYKSQVTSTLGTYVDWKCIMIRD